MIRSQVMISEPDRHKQLPPVHQEDDLQEAATTASPSLAVAEDLDLEEGHHHHGAPPTRSLQMKL